MHLPHIIGDSLDHVICLLIYFQLAAKFRSGGLSFNLFPVGSRVVEHFEVH